MAIYDYASKFRRKKKAWMREKEWVWHIVHTDAFSDMLPRIVPLCGPRRPAVSYGVNTVTNWSNGPNNNV